MRLGAYDSGCLFTGYAVEHKGAIYLYYCGNQNENGRMMLIEHLPAPVVGNAVRNLLLGSILRAGLQIPPVQGYHGICDSIIPRWRKPCSH